MNRQLRLNRASMILIGRAALSGKSPLTLQNLSRNVIHLFENVILLLG